MCEGLLHEVDRYGCVRCGSTLDQVFAGYGAGGFMVTGWGSELEQRTGLKLVTLAPLPAGKTRYWMRRDEK